MTGNERLVLTGGVMNHALFEHALDMTGSEQPVVLMDQMAAYDQARFEAGSRNTMALRQAFPDVTINLLQTRQHEMPSLALAQDYVDRADLLVVSNGNLVQLLERWKELGIYDKITNRVRQGELVAYGAGAGALAWFETAHTSSAQDETAPGKKWPYHRLSATGVLSAWATVHYSDQDNLGRERSSDFYKRLRIEQGSWRYAVGLQTNAAIVSSEGIAQVTQLAGSDNASVYGFHMASNQPIPVKFRDGDRIASLSARAVTKSA